MTTSATVFEILKVVATFLGLGLAIAGLFTWRRQLHGTVEYDLARRLLRRVYAVRDRMAEVRHPFIDGGEFLTAFKEAGVTPNEQGAAIDPRSSRLVYNRRWSTLTSATSDLDVELLEAEVIWGKTVREAQRSLRAQIGELYVAILRHVEEKEDPQRWAGSTPESWKQQQRILYDMSSPEKPDDFTRKVLAAVEQFEAIVRPHLRRPNGPRAPSVSAADKRRIARRLASVCGLAWALTFVSTGLIASARAHNRQAQIEEKYRELNASCIMLTPAEFHQMETLTRELWKNLRNDCGRSATFPDSLDRRIYRLQFQDWASLRDRERARSLASFGWLFLMPLGVLVLAYAVRWILLGRLRPIWPPWATSWETLEPS